MKIADIRKEYKLETLFEKDTALSPFKQFDKWWQQAIESKIEEVNALTLATVNDEGKPSARIVLLKGYDSEGFVFFTNYQSGKAKNIESNQNVAVVIFWKELERQIRIEGKVEKINAVESDAYFLSRPKESQIGAWASPQSSVIPSRDFLEKKVEEYNVKFSKEEITRPQHWGGYIVRPDTFEFWQGRESRLHDRLVYKLQANGEWTMVRLAP